MSTRYCKDCRWMERWGGGSVCGAPKSPRAPVDGVPYVNCIEQRHGSVLLLNRERCGEEGDWYEAKPLPWWRRWFA